MTPLERQAYGVFAGDIAAEGNGPGAGDTLTVNGTTITFIARPDETQREPLAGNQVLLGDGAAQTMQNLLDFLSRSREANLSCCRYALKNTLLIVMAKSEDAAKSCTLSSSTKRLRISRPGLARGPKVVNSLRAYHQATGDDAFDDAFKLAIDAMRQYGFDQQDAGTLKRFDKIDEGLVHRMERLIRSGRARSFRDAAAQTAGDARPANGGTFDSVVRRLCTLLDNSPNAQTLKKILADNRRSKPKSGPS